MIRFTWALLASRRLLIQSLVYALIAWMVIFSLVSEINQSYPFHIDDLSFESHIDQVLPDILFLLSVFGLVLSVTDHDHPAFMPLHAYAGRMRVAFSVVVVESLLILFIQSLIAFVRLVVPILIRWSYHPDKSVHLGLLMMAIDALLIGHLMIFATNRQSRGLLYIFAMFMVMVSMDAIILPSWAAFFLPVSALGIHQFDQAFLYQCLYGGLFVSLILIKAKMKTLS